MRGCGRVAAQPFHLAVRRAVGATTASRTEGSAGRWCPLPFFQGEAAQRLVAEGAHQRDLAVLAREEGLGAVNASSGSSESTPAAAIRSR